jgi:hypothetical protein
MQKLVKERLEWVAVISVEVAILATGIGIILVAKATDVPDWPWVYVGFFITAVGLIGELALGVANADRASHHPEHRRRH